MGSYTVTIFMFILLSALVLVGLKFQDSLYQEQNFCEDSIENVSMVNVSYDDRCFYNDYSTLGALHLVVTCIMAFMTLLIWLFELQD